MALKNLLAVCCLLCLASQAYSRSIQTGHSGFYERNSDVDLIADASRNRVRSKDIQQGRVLPNPIIAKKLLLLKLKKLIPISLILLRSENGEDADLIPVYESSLTSSNADGSINSSQDIALAIPTELSNKNEITQALQALAATKDQQNIKIVDDDEPLYADEEADEQVVLDAPKPPALRSKVNIPFEDSSLYLYPYQENRGTKQTRRNLARYHN